MDILHTCINVANMDRSIDFYTKQMGFRLIYRGEAPKNERGEKEIAYVIDESNRAIQLRHQHDTKPLVESREGEKLDHIGVGVDDLDGKLQELKSKGVAIVTEPRSTRRWTGSATKVAFIKDPDGNLLELIQSEKRY